MAADREPRRQAPHKRPPLDLGAVGSRTATELLDLASTPLAAGLYLVATPIGHLGDITLRALAVLAGADSLYCEDTRHSAHLLRHYAIDKPLRSYHEHNAEQERPRILKALGEGQSVALFSDAGTPLVSDPGFKLVREATLAGHRVFSIPGASAPVTALVASGLPTDSFMFAGFLPVKEGARRARVQELANVPGTLLFFEAPTRVGAALEDLAGVLGNRPAAIARELTKLHEDYHRGTLVDLAEAYRAREVKGEVVIVVGPPEAGEVTDAQILERLQSALETSSLRDGARIVSELLGVPKARVYDIGLGLKKNPAS